MSAKTTARAGKRKVFNTQIFKYGSVSILFTVIFVVLVLSINLVMDLISTRVSTRVDLTSTARYQFDEQTKDFLANLKTPVTITVLSSELEYSPYIVESLERYNIMSDNITVNYIDVYKNPSYLSKYPQNSKLVSGSIIVESPTRYRAVALSEMFIENKETGELTSLRVEQRITSAIMYVCAEEVPKLYFLHDHGENMSLEGMRDLFETNNILVGDISLQQNGIDPSAKYLVIVSPTTDYSPEEIKMLDAYLENNNKFEHNIICLLDARTPPLPNLEAFLAEWGIAIENNVVLDKDNSIGGDPSYVVPVYADGGLYSKDINSQGLICVVPSGRSLKKLFDSKDIRSVSTILSSSISSYGKNGVDENNFTKTDQDPEGPFNLMLMSSKTRYEGLTPISSSILVSGSMTMFSDGILSKVSFANGELLLNILNAMRNETDRVRIVSKDMRNKELTIKADVSQPLSYVFIAGMPLTVLLIGFIVWMTRRHL